MPTPSPVVAAWAGAWAAFVIVSVVILRRILVHLPRTGIRRRAAALALFAGWLAIFAGSFAAILFGPLALSG